MKKYKVKELPEWLKFFIYLGNNPGKSTKEYVRILKRPYSWMSKIQNSLHMSGYIDYKQLKTPRGRIENFNRIFLTKKGKEIHHKIYPIVVTLNKVIEEINE